MTETNAGLLDARSAAAWLKISPRTLYAITHPRGPLPVVRLGARVLYDPADLRAYVESMKLRPARDGHAA